MTREQRVSAFLADLSEVSREHGIHLEATAPGATLRAVDTVDDVVLVDELARREGFYLDAVDLLAVDVLDTGEPEPQVEA